MIDEEDLEMDAEDEESSADGLFSGKAFEESVMDFGKRSKKAGNMLIGRFGTISSFAQSGFRPTPSHPDFDCALYGGRQVVIEAKVTRDGSLAFNTSKIKVSQVRYMLERSAFGVPCFLLIHYHKRELKTKTVDEATILYPILPDDARCQQFVKTKKAKGLGLDEAIQKGVKVLWTVENKRQKVELPDVFSAVMKLKHLFEQ